MKICIVSQFFPPRVIGGGEYAAYITAKALAFQGNDVEVLTSHQRVLLPSAPVQHPPIHEVIDKIAIHRVLGLKTLKSKLIDLTGLSTHILFFLHSFLVISLFAKTRKPDIIHALNIESIPAAVMAAKLCGIPVVVTVNSNVAVCPKGDLIDSRADTCKNECDFLSAKECIFSNLQNRPWRGFLFLETFCWYSFVRIFIRHADKVIGVSNYIKNLLVRNAVSSEKIEVIPEMMNLDFLKPMSDAPSRKRKFLSSAGNRIVLYAGAIFDYRKGSKILIEAMPMVLRELPNTVFVITGAVPEKEIETIKKGNLMRSVIFTNLIPRDRMPTYYQIADVVVFPNVAPEPFGLVLTEAMGRKRPVIASSTGGIPEIIENGINGILVKPGDPVELSKAIINVLKDDSLAKRLSEEGRSVVVRRFSEQTILNSLTIVYQSLLEKAGVVH